MLKKTKIILTISIIAFATQASSQMGKADKLVEKGEFINAVPIYKKESKSKTIQRKQEALIKLGTCYKALNNYTLAEQSYAAALDMSGDVPPETFSNYAQILKINNKYDEA